MSPLPDSWLRPEPSKRSAGPGSRVPHSVRYARGLLWLQGGIWALLAVVGAIDGAISLAQVLAAHSARSSNAVAGAVVGLSIAVMAGGLAALKMRLAMRITRASGRTRKTAIVVEVAMTCLGILMTVSVDYSGGVPADLIALAALIGGGLSLAAAIGLLRRKARQYGAMEPPVRTATDSNGDRNARSSGPLPATVRNRLRWQSRPDLEPCYA
jgi:hypothetical protein